MGDESKAGDLEVSTFVSVYSGKWPAESDKDVHSGRQKTKRLQVRWARWDHEERTLEVGAGKVFTPVSKCLRLYVFLPPHPASPPFIFAGDEAPPSVGQALDRVAQHAAERRTPLSVLVDQAVDSIALEVYAGTLDWNSLGLPDEDEQLFSDVYEIAATKRQSMDALICLATAACRSLRRVTIFDPFPYMFLDSLGGQDFDACRLALETLPPVRTLARLWTDGQGQRGGGVAAGTGLSEPQGKLLRWLTDLKGVGIKGEDRAGRGADARWEGTGIEPVYELVLEHGDDPELAALEAKHGAVDAFHGSALENFHCILRCGLKCFSGDRRRMRTGDMYGEGVYLSSDLRLAHSFAGRGMGWDRSEFGKYLTCIAACRVVLHPAVKHRKETARVEQRGRPMDEFPHTYYVVPDPRYIRVTSLIFVSDRPASAAAAAGAGGAEGARREQPRGGGAGWGTRWVWMLVLVLLGVVIKWWR